MFQFVAGFDHDTIVDFEDDVDTIAIAPSFRYESVSELLADSGVVTEVGADVIIDLGQGNTVFVRNMTIAELRNDLTFTFS